MNLCATSVGRLSSRRYRTEEAYQSPGQAKPIKCYNCNGLGHIARECPRPKRLQDSDYFKDKMLLMQAHRVVTYWMKNSLCFIVRRTAGTSYDSNTPSEVHDHDTFENHLDEYHEVTQKCKPMELHNYDVDSGAELYKKSNTIRMISIGKDNEDSHTVQEAPDFNSFFKIKNLKHQIQEKDNVIRHLKDLVTNVNDRRCEPFNAIDVTAVIEQNDCDRVELEKVKQQYKELYDSYKITRAHTSEKTSTMLNAIESLKAQLRSKKKTKGLCLTSDLVNQKYLLPGRVNIPLKQADQILEALTKRKNRILPAKKENKRSRSTP
ncbi:retrovirus-related pol polyprotein from transposon TNT 1-94 [Tanacetum coccineum]|uniref:Retrovirus-related pol polyprotein from transposon TNT 1-94 n=1 Tax=Tanacetum coccineum TaxID=301880 RepID=A0ABQ5GEG9_9ASTR